jgi:hypothetical protein
MPTKVKLALGEQLEVESDRGESNVQLLTKSMEYTVAN